MNKKNVQVFAHTHAYTPSIVGLPKPAVARQKVKGSLEHRIDFTRIETVFYEGNVYGTFHS